MSSASGTDWLVYIQLWMTGLVPVLMSRSSFEPPVVNTVAPGGSAMKSHAFAAGLPVQFDPVNVEHGFLARCAIGRALLASTAALTWFQSSPGKDVAGATGNFTQLTLDCTPEPECEAAGPPPATARVTVYVRLNAPL